MKKIILIFILGLIIIATFGLSYFLLPEVLTEDQKANSQANNQISPEEAQLRVLEQGSNKTANISDDLQTIDLGDINKEFTDIDKDINNL